MARIRKSTQRQTSGQQNIWRIGKYIRLSREDGNEVSESIVNPINEQIQELTKAVRQR